MRIGLKRAYEPVAEGDGLRILVDRLWPRGVGKEKARIELWLKDIAPSDELRRWYGHIPQRWEEFKRRYFAELEERPEAVTKLREAVGDGRCTLVFAARDRERNNAVVLKEYLERNG